MKKKSKVLALVLSVLMFAMTVNYSVLAFDEADASAEATENDNVLNKIHFYFDVEDNYTIDSLSELNEATASLATNGISTFSATGGEPTENEINVTVEFSSNFMETEAYQAFLEERDTLDDIEEVHEWRARLNAYSKEFHQNLVNKSLAALADFEYSEYDFIGYSPFVVLKTDIADVSESSLVNLAECDNVEHISLAYKGEYDAEIYWSDVVDCVGATDIINDGLYTGQKIRIGIFEAGGVCNKNDELLMDKNITIRDSLETYSEHATIVTSVAAMIAPNAEFYVSPTNYDENEVGIEWFIQQGCDIVNCSWSAYYNKLNSNGTYDYVANEYRYDFDAIYDYQIDAHLITVVKSAGNKCTDNTEYRYNPCGEIGTPGYAHNVITVGGLILGNGYVWKHNSDACYVVDDDRIKPNISAPFTVRIGEKTYQGTSLSTPIVTGCIALIMESNVMYPIYPECVLSVITSTAEETYDYSATLEYFDVRVGAGIINLSKMIDGYANIASDYVNVANGGTSVGTEIINEYVYLDEGREIQIGLAWFVSVAENAKTSSDIYLTNYDLYLYDYAGNLIASSELTNSNVELIRATITSSERYEIVVRQTGPIVSNNDEDFLSLTYNYWG